MVSNPHIQNSDSLSRIVQYLMLNGSFLDNSGLLTGKMGIVTFLFHYSRYANDTIYGEFAGELLDEVIEEIHTETPVGFASGFCGIGWSILHLIEQGFVDADPDEVLSDIDYAIMKYDVRKITDTSLHTGLLGIAHYMFQRKNIDTTYMQELHEKIQSYNIQIPNNNVLQQIIAEVEVDENIFEQKNPIISISGIAGMGLKLLFESNERL